MPSLVFYIFGQGTFLATLFVLFLFLFLYWAYLVLLSLLVVILFFSSLLLFYYFIERFLFVSLFFSECFLVFH